ncbi:ABC transporter permease [Nocardiopsis mangrovi]|uniref:ABC transporter permease n=1 Tax=Nocardiopsis mangrovi TaxID=1179818 RepID=A0ABV9E6W8_9ACTN
MFRTTMAGLRLHKGRLVTTALAIALGVMFVAGTLVFSDTLSAAYSARVMGSADSLDAVARPAPDGAQDGDEGLSADVLDDIRALPEVDDADGIIHGDAALLDKDGRAVGTVPTAGISVGGVVRHQADEGALPAAGDEAALATVTADATGYGIGDTVSVLDAGGERHEFTVTGLIDVGVDAELAYRGAVAFTHSTAAAMTGRDDFSEIDVIGAEGTSDEQVAEAVAGAAGDRAEVATGQEMGEELASAAGGQARTLGTALLLFALISVVVASIVIYNTFSILLAQRQRELALLRCVGASRGQVFRGVLLEALIVGLVASALGVLAGIGVGAAGAWFGGAAAGAGGPATPVVGLTPVAVGLLVGTVVTLLSAVLPARRATNVPPLAALRTSAVAAGLEKGIGWRRILVAVVFFLASAGLLALAMLGGGPEAGLILVVAAGMVAFIGVVVVSPLLVRAVVAVAGVPMRRMGVASMLAADNARRSPKRAAAAMIALAVGATLITGYSVVDASLRATLDEQLDRQFPADYQLNSQYTDDESSGMPADVAANLASSPEIELAVSERRADTEGAGGQTLPVATYAGGRLGTDIDSDVEQGDLADVGPGTVAVSGDFTEGGGVGTTLSIETEEGPRDYEIVAVTSEMQQLWGVTMDPADFASAFPGTTTDSRVLVRAAEGADPADVRDAVYDAVAEYPTVQVESMAQVRQQFDEVLGIAFLTIAAMLGLAILIAVVGIANTMALSVLERARESALLRALGVSGRQLRTMLGLEAVLLSLTGAAVGIGLGVLFGWAAGSAALEGMLFTLPAGQIGLFIAVALAAGLLASALPARRAARTSISGTLAGE